MKFVLRNGYRGFTRRASKYFFVMLEIFIGALVVACSMNYFFSSERRFEELSNQIAESQIKIEFFSQNAQITSLREMPITNHDFSLIAEKYSATYHIEFSQYAMGMLINTTGAAQNAHVLFLSPDIYQKLGIHSISEIFIGSNIEEALYGPTQNRLNDFSAIDAMQILVGDTSYTWYPLETQSLLLDKIILNDLFSEMTYELSDCIILPAILLNSNVYESSWLGLPSFQVIPKDNYETEKITHDMNDIVNTLAANHAGFTYKANMEQLTSLEKRMNDLRIDIDIFFWIACVSFGVVLVGSIGTILVLSYSRQSELAVRMALGASALEIVTELFIEVMLMVVLSVSAALGLSLLITPSLSNSFCIVTSDIKTWLAVFIMSIIISALSSIPYIVRVYSGKISIILKKF